MTYRQGQIVEVSVTDPDDKNEKPRPVLILTPTEELSDEILVASISTKFPRSLPPHWIPLPWDSSRHRFTGLIEPSVVKCDWLRTIAPSDNLQLRGFVSNKKLAEVLRALRALQAG